LTIEDAHNFCLSIGGKLPEPQSAEELTLFINFRFDPTPINEIWIGFNDIKNDGVWVANSDGTTPMSYEKWATGYPTVADTIYDCVVMNTWSDRYFNTECQNRQAITICEKVDFEIIPFPALQVQGA
jgi:hypothetical protein